MGTQSAVPLLSSALFGKGRREILSLLFGRAGESFYLRQIVRATSAGHGAVQRELRQLAEAGIVKRMRQGRQVFYQADPRCPVFAELKGLLLKTAGMGDVLRRALAPLAGRVRAAFVFGSLARGKGRADSDVDLMVVGDVTFADVSDALQKAQGRLGRDVNPTVYPPEELHRKISRGHHFLTSVLKSPKMFLIGDERALEGLAAGRAARRP